MNTTLHDDSDGHVDPDVKYLSWDQFIQTYKPFSNHFNVDGVMMFETYGEELEFVQSQPAENVWTLLDSDNDLDVVITNGMHFVNRINYLVTQVPHNPHEEIIVND